MPTLEFIPFYLGNMLQMRLPFWNHVISDAVVTYMFVLIHEVLWRPIQPMLSNYTWTTGSDNQFLPWPNIGLPYLVCKSIRILHECEVLIEKSVPRVTVWHQEGPPSDAQLWPEGQICWSVHKTHDRFFFFAHLWVPTLDFIHIYLEYFAFTSAILILTSFFRFLWRCAA